jgi:hypothetical protein
MDEHERERYAILTAEIQKLSRGLVGLVTDAVRHRSFAQHKATIIAGLDVAIEIAEALVPLDAAVVEERRTTFAAAKKRAEAEFEARQSAQAEAIAAARARSRAELAAQAQRVL